MCPRLTGCARRDGAGQDKQGDPQEAHCGGTVGVMYVVVLLHVPSE
jgi:hypothetical protein